MRTGETCRAQTNAELLNQLLGKTYKQWYKSTYQLTVDTMIWMANFDYKLRAGWCNQFKDGKIIEEFHGNIQPTNMYLGMQVKKRVVFEKTWMGYVFRGVYQYNAENSNPRHRELVKIADTYTFVN